MQSTPLKDIVEFIRTGKTPPTKDTQYFNGEIQWFTPGDLDKGKLLVKSTRTLTDLAFIDKKAVQFPPNTLLVACIGDIGKLGVTTKECSSNQQITGIKPKANVDVSYLYYWFIHNKVLIQNTANNAVVPILNNKTLEKIKVAVPSLANQQKIAAILDAADSLRQKDQQLVERYTALSQSLFLEMFGDPFEGETYMLEKHVDIVGGFAFKSSDFVVDGIPVVKIGTVNKGYFDTENFSFLPKEFLEKYRKWVVNEGDILISLTGTVGKDDYGNVEQATNEYASYLLNQRVAKLSPINESYLSDFLFGMFANKKTKNELTKISRGVRQANISNKDIQQLKMIKPPISEQKKYSEAMNTIKKQKQQAQRSLEKSEALFNSLLQRAFTGELTTKMAA